MRKKIIKKSKVREECEHVRVYVVCEAWTCAEEAYATLKGGKGQNRRPIWAIQASPPRRAGRSQKWFVVQ